MKKRKNKKQTNKHTNTQTKQWTDNQIGDSGASKISESLKINTTLTKLNLFCDEIRNKNEKKKQKKNEE